MKLRIALCAVFGMLLATAVSTQAQHASSGPNKVSSYAAVAPPVSTCDYQFFVSGTVNNSAEFCVSVNGNVVSYAGPQNYEYIAFGPTVSEGYGLCDTGTATEYYDYADGGALGWGAPTTLSSTATAVKIQRTTTDNAFVLTQTFTKVLGTTPYLKITSVLKNNTTVPKNVYLLRWANVHPVNAQNTGSYTESFDSSVNAAWGYTSLNYSGPNFYGYGVMLENLGAPNVPVYGQGGYVFGNTFPPNPCNPNPNYVGYVTGVDGSIEMLYNLEQLGAKKTVTVNTRYLAF